MATKHKSKTQRVFFPRFLLASPHLRGTPYDRQVTYLLEHTDEQAVGLLLDQKFCVALRSVRDYLDKAALQLSDLPEHVASLPVTVVTWGPGQLDRELKYGVWLSGPAEFERVFGDYEDLWGDLVRQVGQAVLRDALHIHEFPAPTLN